MIHLFSEYFKYLSYMDNNKSFVNLPYFSNKIFVKTKMLVTPNDRLLRHNRIQVLK